MTNKKQVILNLFKNIAKNTKYGKMLEVIKGFKKTVETPGTFLAETPLGKSIREKGWGKALAEGFSKETRTKQPEWMQVAQTIPLGYVMPGVKASDLLSDVIPEIPYEAYKELPDHLLEFYAEEARREARRLNIFFSKIDFDSGEWQPKDFEDARAVWQWAFNEDKFWFDKENEEAAIEWLERGVIHPHSDVDYGILGKEFKSLANLAKEAASKLTK